MRVAVCHNYYQQPGGEDTVFHAEVDLLRRHGMQVFPHTVHNDAVGSISTLTLARKTIWNRETASEIEQLVRREKIDVVHFHNTLPLFSPAAYYGARRAGAAVVKTLHNYRMACPGSTLFRQGTVCEKCLGKAAPWPGVAHGCYRGSRMATAGVAAMLTTHRLMGTYSRAVDAYIVLSEFARGKLLEGGLPPEKTFIKPNFLEPDPGVGEGDGGYAFFLGRLSPEKGVRLLLKAWEEQGCTVPLKIGGSGPLEEEVAAAADRRPHVEALGRLSAKEVDFHMKRASFLVLPSVNYEGFPRTVVEAYARGLPVLASRLGSLEELIHDGETGAHFAPYDPADLAQRAEALFADTEALRRQRLAARSAYERQYRGDTNFQQLQRVYQNAIAARGRSKPVERPQPNNQYAKGETPCAP
ncbi:MAG: glycosyltransferase [Acidobacteria bacterium]|nr:glycosyltransferase [Acidobacteriota bacterium]